MLEMAELIIVGVKSVLMYRSFTKSEGSLLWNIAGANAESVGSEWDSIPLIRLNDVLSL